MGKVKVGYKVNDKVKVKVRFKVKDNAKVLVKVKVTFTIKDKDIVVG